MSAKLMQTLFTLGAIAVASSAWPAEIDAAGQARELAECRKTVDAHARRLLPAARRIAAERGTKLPAIALSVVPELSARKSGEQTRPGDELAGDFDVDTNTIQIALRTCQRSQVEKILAHELGHALDFAATNRYYALSEVVLMPRKLPPLSKEDAADYYGNMILSRSAAD